MGEPGRPRTYFNRRFVDALNEVIRRKALQEAEPKKMVNKVNLQDALNCLQNCPVCATEIIQPQPGEDMMVRSCTCGDFTITEVYANGDITFEFHMVAQTMIEPYSSEWHGAINELKNGGLPVEDSDDDPEQSVRHVYP